MKFTSKLSSPADVKIDFRVMVAQEVRDKNKYPTEENVDGGNKDGYKVFVEINEMLKLENIQELDDLPS